MDEWRSILVEPAKTVLSQVGVFLANILLVLFILLVGWLVAKAVRIVVVRVLKVVKVDSLSDRIELDKLLEKGGIVYPLSELLGLVVYWIGLLISFVVAINAVGLTIAADLLNRVILYIPNIIAAIFILILGMFVATLLRNIVRTAATNTGLLHAQLLAKIVEVVVIIFAVTMTLEQLGIRATVIELSISIVLASFGLALGLAFGFGCQDLARKAMSDLIDKFRTKA